MTTFATFSLGVWLLAGFPLALLIHPICSHAASQRATAHLPQHLFRSEDSTGRIQTCCTLTKTGCTALQGYILALQQLLPLEIPAWSVPAKRRGAKVQST